jgi:hypothetical protein
MDTAANIIANYATVKANYDKLLKETKVNVGKLYYKPGAI